MIVLKGNRALPQIVATFDSVRGGSHTLDRREQQSQEN
jgi:hypothetical protein